MVRFFVYAPLPIIFSAPHCKYPNLGTPCPVDIPPLHRGVKYVLSPKNAHGIGRPCASANTQVKLAHAGSARATGIEKLRIHRAPLVGPVPGLGDGLALDLLGTLGPVSSWLPLGTGLALNPLDSLGTFDARSTLITCGPLWALRPVAAERI